MDGLGNVNGTRARYRDKYRAWLKGWIWTGCDLSAQQHSEPLTSAESQPRRAAQWRAPPATRWNVRITGRTAENAANLAKGDRLLITGTGVTDTWKDKTIGDTRYGDRVFAQSVGASLTPDPSSIHAV